MRNYVKKNMFQKAAVYKDRKKDAKLGYQKHKGYNNV